MKKKLVGMLATATLLTMALAGNVQAAEIRSVGPDGKLTDQYALFRRT